MFPSVSLDCELDLSFCSGLRVRDACHSCHRFLIGTFRQQRFTPPRIRCRVVPSLLNDCFHFGICSPHLVSISPRNEKRYQGSHDKKRRCKCSSDLSSKDALSLPSYQVVVAAAQKSC